MLAYSQYKITFLNLLKYKVCFLKFFYSLLFVLSCIWSVQAQITPSIRLDSAKMYIGDQQTLHLSIQFDESVEIDKIDWSVLDSTKIEVINKGNVDNHRVGVYNQDMLFTVWDTGQYKLPFIPIHYTRNGEQFIAATTYTYLTVTNPPESAVGLNPIKTIIDEPRNWEDFIWLFLLLALAIVAGIAYFLYQKQKKTPSAPILAIAQLTPHERALRNLEQLRQAELWQKGNPKQYYIELSHILREYVAQRYQMPALELTTDELQARLQQNNQTDNQVQTLIQVLRNADLVKFAKADLDATTHEYSFENALVFVQKTKNVFIPSPATNTVVSESGVSKQETKPSKKRKIAPFYLRFVAFLLDMVVIGFISILFFQKINLGGRTIGEDYFDASDYTVVYLVVLFLYHAIMEYHWGATVGKRLAHIEVTDLDGNSITMLQAVLRSLIRLVVICLGGILTLFLLRNNRRQGLYDWAVGTLVLEK
ncbi:MAG: hypothetical protein RLZZ292_2026 [Bacteroidota bacterium]|jgi:uncharacterized RDD family membrane protein YckC